MATWEARASVVVLVLLDKGHHLFAIPSGGLGGIESHD